MTNDQTKKTYKPGMKTHAEKNPLGITQLYEAVDGKINKLGIKKKHRRLRSNTNSETGLHQASVHDT